MELAEYLSVVARQIMETTFTNDLHPKISLAVMILIIKVSEADLY